ncbi:MAG: tetratricopeptide repeat protein [bacterium]|nr:tetratricopeptide repeat protein [bacterium]
MTTHTAKSTKKMMKEDELMVFLTKAETWFEKNWRIVAYIAGAAVVVTIIIVFMKMSRASANRDAGFELAEARSFLNRAEYGTATEKLTALIKRRKGTEVADEAQLTLARVKLVEGKSDEAEKQFRDFLKENGKGLKGIAAANGIAIALENQGKQKEAYEMFRKVYTMDPKGASAPQALLDAARISLLMNDHEKAKESALALIREFPQSTLRTQADEILQRTGR